MFKKRTAICVVCYRYFEIPSEDGSSEPQLWWFGGGADLTPMYLVEEVGVLCFKQHERLCICMYYMDCAKYPPKEVVAISITKK